MSVSRTGWLGLEDSNLEMVESEKNEQALACFLFGQTKGIRCNKDRVVEPAMNSWEIGDCRLSERYSPTPFR